MCTLRASKQKLAFFKQFQGHLCLSTELSCKVYEIDGASVIDQSHLKRVLNYFSVQWNGEVVTLKVLIDPEHPEVRTTNLNHLN